MIRPLTRYVMDAALADCAGWSQEGLRPGVSVNLSARDLLDADLPREVESLLSKHGVDPTLLEVEITEHTILTDPERARIVLERLRELGVTLSIDDFGTGFSSLGQLKRLPVDVLKIDRSFVLNMEHDDNDDVIVRSTSISATTSASASSPRASRRRRPGTAWLSSDATRRRASSSAGPCHESCSSSG